MTAAFTALAALAGGILLGLHLSLKIGLLGYWLGLAGLLACAISSDIVSRRAHDRRLLEIETQMAALRDVVVVLAKELEFDGSVAPDTATPAPTVH